MAIVWPDSLVSELAERRCIVFMGAGASMGSVSGDGKTHPPSWDALLRGALKLLPRPTDRRFASKLLADNQYLDAAEIIREKAPAADFGQYLDAVFVTPRFGPSNYHKIIRDIDAKIVITTNYDKIYDEYCVASGAAAGYRISRYHDPVLVEGLRSRLSLVIKAHGCVSQPNQIVLSRSSYYKAKRDYPGFYSVLDALFLTQTILFVGCSLTDPDIRLVLENANISVPSAHPHYALVEKIPHQTMKSAIKLMHNIEVVEFPVGEFSQGEEALADLRDRVQAKRALH